MYCLGTSQNSQTENSVSDLLGASKSLSGIIQVFLCDCSPRLTPPQSPQPTGDRSHEAGPVPLRGPVVVVDVVSAAQVVHLLLPAGGQRGRRQLLLPLRRAVAGIHHVPAVLGNEGKTPLWSVCLTSWRKEFNLIIPLSLLKGHFQRWLVAWCQREPIANSVSRALSFKCSWLYNFSSALPQSHPSDHCFLPLGHHFWACTPSSVSRNPSHEICGCKTRRYIEFNSS